jgi:hypothetical protein
MAFIKRLGWYLVGVSIGLVFLAFILKKKSGEDGINFCYLPNCRVLKDFRSKPLTFSNQLKEQMPLVQLDSVYFSKVFTDGDVNFGKSNTEAKPCKLYYVEFEKREIQLQSCVDKIIIDRVSKME